MIAIGMLPVCHALKHLNDCIIKLHVAVSNIKPGMSVIFFVLGFTSPDFQSREVADMPENLIKSIMGPIALYKDGAIRLLLPADLSLTFMLSKRL